MLIVFATTYLARELRRRYTATGITHKRAELGVSIWAVIDARKKVNWKTVSSWPPCTAGPKPTKR